MSNKTEELHRDNMLGGLVIVLLGVLLSASAVWGVVDDVYSMNGGFAPVIFFILGVGSIIWGITIFIHKPEA